MDKKKLDIILKLHIQWVTNGEGCRADLREANLIGADLSGANLIGADLTRADLMWADLRWANLSRADLSGADLTRADLRWANLRWANLSGADLSGADLSGADGLLSSIEFCNTHFEKTVDGYIAYKTFNDFYTSPNGWKIEAGSVITENVLFDKCSNCGCGINVGSLEWVKKHCNGVIWKVLIRWEWLCGVCVPYNSDGKIRCEKVELVEAIEKKD